MTTTTRTYSFSLKDFFATHPDWAQTGGTYFPAGQDAAFHINVELYGMEGLQIVQGPDKIEVTMPQENNQVIFVAERTEALLAAQRAAA